MAKEDFKINYYAKRRRYSSSVFITYQTDNVMRFTVTGGEKEIYLEKHLFKKTHQWKYSGTNFTPSWQSRDNEEAIKSITDAIDFILANKSNRRMGY